MKFKEYLHNYLNEGMLSILGSGKNIENFNDDSKPISIKTSDKNKYSNSMKKPHYKSLAELTNAVSAGLSKAGVQAHTGSGSGEEWTGMFSGALSSEETAKLKISLAKDGINAKNELILSIYKMPSGNYELVSYIS